MEETGQQELGVDIPIDEEVDRFFDESSKPQDGVPRFVLYTGIPGSGKTTLRQRQCPKGYVVIDANEIYRNLCEKRLRQFHDYRALEYLVEVLGLLIAKRALREKRNIAVEMIGGRGDQLDQLVNKFNAVGYETALRCISCSWQEAHRRHAQKVAEDPLYVSCYFTEESHERWLFWGLKELG